jgi:uncharacterized membrane protein
MNSNTAIQENAKAEINVLPPEALPKAEPLKAIQEKTRKEIAIVVVFAYIILVVLNLVLPMIMYFSYWPPKEPLGISDVKDLMSAISGVLSGFVSILGFIIGYYFKAAEEDIKKSAPEGLGTAK